MESKPVGKVLILKGCLCITFRKRLIQDIQKVEETAISSIWMIPGSIYISGDTEDIQEMRGLENIDVAFASMNLPYTMDIHQAAEGVLAFEPAIIYPYHYRRRDVEAFKRNVETQNKGIDVRLRKWY